MPLQSTEQRSVTNACFSSPILGAHSAAIDREVVCDGGVPLLNILRDPSAIGFGVWAIDIHPVYRMPGAWSFSHIFFKLLEAVFAKPFRAHHHAFTPVICVCRVRPAIAPTFHRLPDHSLLARLPSINMLPARFSKRRSIFNAEAPAGFRVTFRQAVSRCLSFVAAFTDAFPPRARPLLSSVQNGKPAEFLSNKIKCFRHEITLDCLAA